MPDHTLNLRKALLAGFVIAELCLLAWWLSRLDGQYDNEDFLFFQILLVALSFPSGLIVLILISLADLAVPIFAGHTRLAAVGIWLMLALAAWVQWFVWTPLLLKRIRSWWHRRSEA